LVGCAPAEPASVSPGERRVTGEAVREQDEGEALVLCQGSGREKGAAAEGRKVREGREVASGVPRLTVMLVKVRVP
jgi:hypothetical protein